MKSVDLKPCPFCGGQVVISITGYRGTRSFFVTRDLAPNRCTCRVFMESEQYNVDDDQEHIDKVKGDLIDAWNRRVGCEEGKPDPGK